MSSLGWNGFPFFVRQQDAETCFPCGQGHSLFCKENQGDDAMTFQSNTDINVFL